jgi:hypothetical protein
MAKKKKKKREDLKLRNNLYRTCIQKSDWQRIPREEAKKEKVSE